MTGVEPLFLVGDVVQMKGAGVPKELESAYWRVEIVHPDGLVQLSKPYEDEALTRYYYAKPPQLKGGQTLL